jgi:hypothetical protein
MVVFSEVFLQVVIKVCIAIVIHVVLVSKYGSLCDIGIKLLCSAAKGFF